MTDKNGIVPRRFTTLVVDDEMGLADLAAELLAYHGIQTIVAYSALEALALLAIHEDIDAVFSDVMMPAMTGFELASFVAKNYPKIRIVLTSGFTPIHHWDGQERDFRFVAKPYSIDTVIQQLRP